MKAIAFLYLFFLSSSLFCFSQTKGECISLNKVKLNTLQKLLTTLHENEGVCSSIKVYDAHLATFIEIADYGPMWYGDTIPVNQDGVLIEYLYDKNCTSDKDQWHSSYSLFIPNDKSSAYCKYTCRFGGTPPSHGFAYRRKNWNEIYSKILNLLRIR